MKHIPSIIRVVLIIFVCLSCDTVFILELPENQPRLVLNFVGCNDRAWEGKISVSESVLDNDNWFSFDLPPKVRILENGKFIAPVEFVKPSSNWTPQTGHLTDWGATFETTSFSPKEGHFYTIEAESIGYPVATASYVHPVTVAIDSFVIKILGTKGSIGSRSMMEVSITIDDPAGENYYALQFSGVLRGPSWELYAAFHSDFVDLNYKQTGFFSNSGVAFLHDQLPDEKKMTIVLRSEFDQGSYSFDPAEFEYMVDFRNLSKEYFEYERTNNLQQIANADPYAQPVKVTNNIKNGFGIFGGFSRTFKTAKLTK